MPCARVASLLILNDEIRAPVVYPMSSLAAATLVIGVLLLVGVPILWLIFNSGTLTPVERDAATREFEFQLQHPEFAALEAHIGRRIPPALMALYANRELLTGQS